MCNRLVRSCFVLRFYLLAWWAVTLGTARAEPGIVTWKEQAFHADASAKAFYFESMKQTGPVTWFYQGDRRMSFERHQPFDFVFIPASLAELNGAKASGLKAEFEKLSVFAAKYPTAGAMLRVRLEQMRELLKNDQAAEVYISGKWVSLSEYERRVAERGTAEPAREVHPAVSDAPAPVATPAKHRALRLAACAVYLAVLVVLVVRRNRQLALLVLALPLMAVFGWFTYEEGGLGWSSKIPEKMKEIPGLLGWPGRTWSE